MRFQKTTEYAIRVMVFLADHREERYSANQLHRILQIPYKYLGRLMHKLSGAGLVDVTQGKQGGYRIIQELSRIYLSEIVNVVEGLGDYGRCVLGFPECSPENPCSLHNMWQSRQESIKNMVYDTTLADLQSNGETKY
ncbi:MAG: Rrf2 family transcriptional regulator [Calditrichaceae bacterium]|jgi:Rrf2 family transcriptional regulator, iron-sulfur cluster assembly transcription factor